MSFEYPNLDKLKTHYIVKGYDHSGEPAEMLVPGASIERVESDGRRTPCDIVPLGAIRQLDPNADAMVLFLESARRMGMRIVIEPMAPKEIPGNQD